MFGVGLHFSVGISSPSATSPCRGPASRACRHVLTSGRGGVRLEHRRRTRTRPGAVGCQHGRARAGADVAQHAGQRRRPDRGRLARGRGSVSALVLVLLPVLAVSLGGMASAGRVDSLATALLDKTDSVLAFSVRQIGRRRIAPALVGVTLLNVAIVVGLLPLARRVVNRLLRRDRPGRVRRDVDAGGRRGGAVRRRRDGDGLRRCRWRWGRSSRDHRLGLAALAPRRGRHPPAPRPVRACCSSPASACSFDPLTPLQVAGARCWPFC